MPRPWAWRRPHSVVLLPLVAPLSWALRCRCELRVSGAMIRPQGAGWLQGVDLIFAAEGSELRYRHAVRRYSFTYGNDRAGGRNPLVTRKHCVA